MAAPDSVTLEAMAVFITESSRYKTKIFGKFLNLKQTTYNKEMSAITLVSDTGITNICEESNQ